MAFRRRRHTSTLNLDLDEGKPGHAKQKQKLSRYNKPTKDKDALQFTLEPWPKGKGMLDKTSYSHHHNKPLKTERRWRISVAQQAGAVGLCMSHKLWSFYSTALIELVNTTHKQKEGFFIHLFIIHQQSTKSNSVFLESTNDSCNPVQSI